MAKTRKESGTARIVLYGNQVYSNVFEAGSNPIIQQGCTTSAPTVPARALREESASVMPSREELERVSVDLDEGKLEVAARRFRLVITDPQDLEDFVQSVRRCQNRNDLCKTLASFNEKYPEMDYDWLKAKETLDPLFDIATDFDRGKSYDNVRKGLRRDIFNRGKGGQSKKR
jgi:hypothetical protein